MHMAAYITDLIAILGPDQVLTDPTRLELSRDYAKNFNPDSSCVVWPQSTEQVVEVMNLAHKRGFNIVPSGGRTGLCGGATATAGEVVLSLQKMNKILSVNRINKTLHCQAGAITKNVQIKAEENGLYFPIDFASSGSSQIGGNIATNAGGIKVIRYGLMRDWVQGLEVVLPSGEILNLKNECIKNNTGYDLKQLFIGSEGTLGVITECLLNLTYAPKNLTVALFAVETLKQVTDLFAACGEHRIPLTAYEFFSDLASEKVNEHTGQRPPFKSPFTVLVEYESETSESEDLFEKFVEVVSTEGLIQDGLVASSSEQAKHFWALRENISESLSQVAVVHKNDISLPISQIASFCEKLQSTLDSQFPGVNVVLFGHIGDGNLHVNFLKPEGKSKEDFFAEAAIADSKMFDLVRNYGGSISAEHGIGLTKREHLGFSRSSLEISIMRDIKKIFDPRGILNPGKIFRTLPQ